VKITAREKKFLVVGGGIVVMSGLLYAALVLIPSGPAPTGTVEFKRRMLLKQKETLSLEQEYKTRGDQYRQRLNQDLTRLLPFDNPTIAAAELQKVLKELADQNGVEIVRRDNQKEQKIQDLIKISVRVETNCVPDNLVQFLSAIENYDKSLSVDELVINSFRIQKKYEIRPIVTVSGYIAAPETKVAEKPAAARL
jgi:type II secretory pathway component PulM